MPESSAQNEQHKNSLPSGEPAVSAADKTFEVLWRVAGDLRRAKTADDVLALVARAIAEAGLYRRAVLTLHNEQGDITAIGYHGIPDEVIAATRRARRISEETRRAILDSANKISASFFVPVELDLDLAGEARYVGRAEPPVPEGQWQPDDELFVPLTNARGKTIGYASVDTPPDGKRPDLATIRRLELFVHLASEALTRVHVRARLHEVQERIERMVTHADDVIFRANVVDNVFEFINPAVEKLTGYSVDELVSHPLNTLMVQIVHPDDLNRLVADWESQQEQSSILDEGAGSVEYRIRRKDGTIRWVWEKRILIRDSDSQAVAIEGVLRDVTEQYKLREKLAESERKYRLLAENTRDLVYAHDFEGDIFYISPSARDFLDAQPDEVINTNISDWLTENPINRAAFEAFNAGVARGETVPPFVLEMRSRAGREFLMEFNESLILDGDGEILGVQGVGRDVTIARQAEEALKKSEERFRQLADLLPQTVFEVDLNRKATFINQYGLAAFGYSKEDVRRGLNGMDLLVPEDREKIEQNARRGLDASRLEGDEYTALRKDGSTFPVLIYSTPIIHDNQPMGFRGIALDLTGRKKAEGELKSERDFVSSLLDTANCLIVCLDKDARITVFNKECELVTGYTREEVLGKSWPKMFLPADHYHSRIGNFADWVRQHPQDVLEGPLITKSGEIRTILWSNSALFSPDGDEFTAIAVGHDVTESKRAEKALRESEEKFRKILSSSPDAITVTDLTGRITECNQAALDLHGIPSREELIGRDAFELIAPEDRDRAMENLKRTLEQDLVKNLEYTLLTRDGQEFQVDLSAAVIRDSIGNPTSFVAVVRDITARKRAEEALQESEEKYRRLFEHESDAVMLFDAETLQFEDANPTTLTLFGYPKDEFLTLRVTDISAEVEKTRDAVQELIDGKTGSIRIPLRYMKKKDGTVFPAEISGGTFTSGGRQRVIGVIRDITARQQAEDALRESEERFRVIAEATPIPLAISRLSDGEIIYGNAALGPALGYTPEEILGINSAALYVDPDAPREIRRLLERDGKITNMEIRGRKADGRIFWAQMSMHTITLNGEPAILGGFIDITESKNVLEALRRSEEQARALLNATTDSVVLADPDGIVLAINEPGARLLGQEADDLVDKCIFDYMPPAIAESRKARGLEVIRTGKPVRFEDERAGMVFDTSVYPIFDAQDKVEGLAIFARDVTERIRVMRQLKRKGKELDRANSVLAEMISELHRKNRRARKLASRIQAKNAELQAMVSMLSHDLKTPLVSIRELTGIFRRRYARLMDEGGQDLARRISSNAANMLRLVDSLLDYSRAEDYIDSTDDIDLGRLVDDIWEQITDAFPNRRAVLRRSPPFSCRFSRLALERILANLLRNAVAYVPEDRTPEIGLEIQRFGDYLQISITDNGIGIPPDQKDKIFELFYRAQPAVTGGSGVGLAVVKRVVDAAHGTITVSPGSAGGTVVTIDLPLAAQSSTSAR